MVMKIPSSYVSTGFMELYRPALKVGKKAVGQQKSITCQIIK